MLTTPEHETSRTASGTRGTRSTAVIELNQDVNLDLSLALRGRWLDPNLPFVLACILSTFAACGASTVEPPPQRDLDESEHPALREITPNGAGPTVWNEFSALAAETGAINLGQVLYVAQV